MIVFSATEEDKDIKMADIKLFIEQLLKTQQWDSSWKGPNVNSLSNASICQLICAIPYAMVLSLNTNCTEPILDNDHNY